MKAAFVFDFTVICIKLLFDAFMVSIDKEEKALCLHFSVECSLASYY